jgi:hypothetical protein
MHTTRLLALTLVVGLASGSLPASTVLAQENGTIAGRAGSEAKRPYNDYLVQLRDPATGQVVKSMPLDNQALFSFSAVPLGRRLVVELLNVKANRIVCTEGPYLLQPNMTIRNDININCGANPAAWWLLLAGAGAATSIAALQASGG